MNLLEPADSLPVLVIGGSGFIGSYLVEALLASGRQVRVLDFGPGRVRHDNLTHWAGSFLQQEILQEAMTGVGTIYHLANSAMPREANRDPRRDCAENVVGSLGILDLAVSRGVRRLVFASSGGTVYGPTAEVPIPEDHPTRPITAYGIGKLSIEKYLRLYDGRGEAESLSTVSLRIANPYGPYQNIAKAQGALTTFCAHAVSGKTIQIWGDGSIERDFIHVSDVARALMLAGDHTTEEARATEINIGAGEGTSLNTLLDLIEKILDRRVVREYLPGRDFDVARNFLNIERARSKLGWAPQVSLQDGVAELLAHFQSQRLS